MILSHIGLDPAAGMDLLLDLDAADTILMEKATRFWALESHTKSTLGTFVQIKDFKKLGVLINANLSRVRRSLAMKSKVGVP